MGNIFRLLLGLLFLLSFTTLNAAENNPRTNSREITLQVDQAILEIDKILDPLIRKSRKDGLNGQIATYYLPLWPDHWRSTAKEPETPFIKNLKKLIRAGVCFGSSSALIKLFEIERLVHVIGLIKIEALFLQRLADARKLHLLFHDRYRTRKRYSANMSEEPQQELRIKVAFDEGRIEDAIKLVPEFSKLCY
jgi:hypothetical protein